MKRQRNGASTEIEFESPHRGPRVCEFREHAGICDYGDHGF